MQQQMQMVDANGMPIDMSQMSPEQQQAYQQQINEQLYVSTQNNFPFL